MISPAKFLSFDIRYGSPGAPVPSSSVLGRIPKNNTTSPTPAATAWTLRQVMIFTSKCKSPPYLTLHPSVTFLQQQPVTESYQYNQISPSRSPSGPTYTQLNNPRQQHQQQNYHTNAPPQSNAGTCARRSIRAISSIQ